jgi:tetrapyrrole methylase family protein/MazG family protein
VAHKICELINQAKQNETMPFDITPLVQVMGKLRGDQGCPWDKSQTHRSLRRYLLEEVYEMLDAIDDGDNEGICEELGDILYQIVIHARIGEENGLFSAQNIVDSITKKMIRRHPHVFDKKRLENRVPSMVNWDRLKQGEQRQQHEHLLDGVVKGLPSLLQAYKLQEKSAKVGFEWEYTEEVWEKFREEWQEFKEAVSEQDQDHMEEEAGDVLFVFANLCRRYHIEPECALHRANSKFRRRFSHVEDRVRQSSCSWHDFTLDELNNFWIEAKKQEGHDTKHGMAGTVSRK